MLLWDSRNADAMIGLGGTLASTVLEALVVILGPGEVA